MTTDQQTRFVLTLSCADRIGIVAAVAGFLAENDCNIMESAQFGDPDHGAFFMRVSFRAGSRAPDGAAIERAFAAIADRFAMDWTLRTLDTPQRVMIMVSRFGHCINDLLFRASTGALDMEVAAIVSNHRDFEALVGSYDIPFHYMPVSAETKAAQEQALLDLIERERIELVVLARYMQVLSPELCSALAGRVINIHHSFLPSFKGAKPYHRAHERGVKLIGATAHYVTPTLDEGPIIEQDVSRVDHAMSINDFVAIGRDIECVVLARALKWHLEHRVLLNGTKTIVFR